MIEWFPIAVFFLMLATGLAFVSIHYRNKYEELKAR